MEVERKQAWWMNWDATGVGMSMCPRGVPRIDRERKAWKPNVQKLMSCFLSDDNHN